MKKLICSILLLISFHLTTPAAATPLNDPVLATYIGSNGLKIISHHRDWTDSTKLKSVYDELMRNTHFDEINYLSAVRIYEGNYRSSYSGGIVTWTWTSGKSEKQWSTDNEIRYFPDPGQGFAGDMAYTLAHEYGHHFTMYYLWTKEKVDLSTNWQQSQYAKLRQLTSNKQVSSAANHEWQPVEIAASDYIQLFGSPNARKSISYSENQHRFSSDMYNLQPQENMSLPLAAQVPGLLDYWRKLTNHTTNGEPPSAPALALTGSRVGSYASRYLKFQWSRSIDDKTIPITYTLLEYDSSQDSLGIPVAIVKDQTQAEKLTYGNEQGTRYYRIIATDSDGFAVASNLLPVNLSKPAFQPAPQSPLFRDVSLSHWASIQINQLVKAGAISGYADHSFKPNQNITRAEFITVLCSTLELTASAQANFSDTQTHWAKQYIATAKGLGLTSGYADNTFKPNNPISRAEAAAMLAKAKQLKTNSGLALPTDSTNHWAKSAISAVITAELMSGYPDGSFKPEHNLTRAEAAALFSRI